MFTFEFSYWSIIIGSFQPSSSHQSGTFLSALCKIIRSLSNRLLFAYFTWFCAFNLRLITKKNEGFARSRATVKPFRWVSSSCALFSRDLISRWSALIFVLCSGCFAIILHTQMSVQGGLEHFTFEWPLQMTVVTESSSDITEWLKMSGFAVHFLQFFFSTSNLFFQNLKIFCHFNCNDWILQLCLEFYTLVLDFTSKMCFPLIFPFFNSTFVFDILRCTFSTRFVKITVEPLIFESMPRIKLNTKVIVQRCYFLLVLIPLILIFLICELCIRY